MESIENITEAASANFDGHIAGHMTYFYGTCASCSMLQKLNG
jgi:Fur family peroxide stress response transcriptional regulator